MSRSGAKSSLMPKHTETPPSPQRVSRLFLCPLKKGTKLPPKNYLGVCCVLSHLFLGVRTTTTLRKSETQVNFVWDLKTRTGKNKKVKPNLEKTLKSNL